MPSVRARACLVGAGWALQAVAQAASLDADLDKLMPLSLMELIEMPVVTASRRQETRDETPAHMVLITREQIRERRYKNLADLLEDLPGVDFQRGTKSSQYNQFTVQGYVGPNKLVVMLDGIRIGHAAGGNFPVAENLSLHMARQVEFVYGPAAALYGADAVAGVVNIISHSGGDALQNWVSAGAGRFGSQEGSFMTGMRQDSGLSLTAGGHWQRSERAPLPEFYPEDFRKVDAKTFSGAVVVPAAEREDYVGDIASHSLFVRIDLGADLSLGAYRNVFNSLTSTGDKPATARYLPDSEWITQTDTLAGKFRFRPRADLSAELVLDAARTEVDPRAKYNNIYNSYIDGYSYVLGERLGIEQNFFWQASASQQVQFGLGHQRHHAIEASSLPAPYNTDRGPDQQGFVYPNTPLPLVIHDAEFDNTSAYLQLQSRWSDQWSSVAGLRVDQHSQYGRSVNPRFGLVWRPARAHVLKALYGQAFRAPSPEEGLSSFGTFDGSVNAEGLYQGSGFRVPNLNLAPEEAQTLSLTWDWRPHPNLNLVTNLYSSRIERLIVTKAASDIYAIPGAILNNPETKGNAGDQRQTGLDLLAQWRFALNPQWTADVWGSASWLRGLVDEGYGVDWDIPYVAAHKFKLGSTLRYRNRLSITSQLYLVGDTTHGRKASAAPTRQSTAGHALVNLHVGWHQLLDGQATLWLDVYNLLDKRYDAAHGAGSRTFFDMPQQPRTWMLSLEYRF